MTYKERFFRILQQNDIRKKIVDEMRAEGKDHVDADREEYKRRLRKAGFYNQ